MIRFIGIAVAVVICLNLVALLLTFFRVWSISNIYLALITAYFAIMVIITAPNFSFTVGGQKQRIRIPVWPGPEFFRFALICSLVLSIAMAVIGEDLINSLHSRKSFFFSRVSNELDTDTFQSRIFLLRNSFVYDADLTPVGRIDDVREVLLKKTLYLSGANEKMALVVFKNKQGNYIKGFEAYVPLSVLEEKTVIQKNAGKRTDRDRYKTPENPQEKSSLTVQKQEHDIEKKRQEKKAAEEKKRFQAQADKKREEESKARLKEQARIAHREDVERKFHQLLAASGDISGWQPEPVWIRELRGKEIMVYFYETNLDLAAKIIKRIEMTGGRTSYVLLEKNNTCPCAVSEICYSFHHLDEATALQAALFDIMPTSMTSSTQTRGRLILNLGG